MILEIVSIGLLVKWLGDVYGEERVYLNIVLCKLLSERPATAGCGINSVVYGDLAVLMVQPSVNILTALLEYLLPQHDRRGRGVWVEVVLGHLASLADSSTTIVSKVKYASLNT